MPADLRDFWKRFQSAGVEVAVDAAGPDRLLGVRDGFLRYFHDGLDRPVPVAVVPQEGSGPPAGLSPTDQQAIHWARLRAHGLRERLGAVYHFYASSEAGLHTIELDGRPHTFVRTWTVLVGVVGEAWGSSGSVELPGPVLESLSGEDHGLAMPGVRTSGGLTSSLTGGLENRRTAVALGTLHALATFFYGILEPRPIRHR
jgi:Protein of unknown function DUF84